MQILQNDYIMLVASGGVECIQVAKAAKPDIILLDIVMPQMNGYEVLAALREMRETKDIPVIFITGLDQEGEEEKGLKLGASDYITKPYNPVIVRLRVRNLLQITEQMRTINELSMVDVTTKLPNRQYFDKRLSEEWQRAENENRQLGILMIEIDTLRSYNTIYGYRNGDAMIIRVSEIISSYANVNPGDFAARWAYGGFVVLLLNVAIGECNTVGENIRKAIGDAVIETSGGEETRVTISVGANSVSPASDDCSIEKFIANVDSALYLAKELGRNQVVVHS